MNKNETPPGKNQFTENNLVNHNIDVNIISKEINDSLTRNDDVFETANENTDTNFDDMLHNNVEYLMDDVIRIYRWMFL